MGEIRIKLDYLNGPLWKDVFNAKTGKMGTGIKSIDDDLTVQILNERAGEIFSSLYSFDEKGVACYFDDVKFEAVKPQLLGLIKTLIYRLSEINDGSYKIVDEETARLSSQVPKAS